VRADTTRLTQSQLSTKAGFNHIGKVVATNCRPARRHRWISLCVGVFRRRTNPVRDLAAPIAAFVRETYEARIDDLYAAFTQWIEGQRPQQEVWAEPRTTRPLFEIKRPRDQSDRHRG